MFKKETWQEIAKELNLDADKLQELAASEKEEALEVPKFNRFTDEQLTSLKETVGKESAKNGSKTIIEMQIKEKREKLGLEFEGKTIDNLLAAYEKKILTDAKIEPSKKIGELTTSLEKLQGTYNTDIEAKDIRIKGLEAEKSQIKSNNDLLRNVPENLKGVTNKQFATLAQSEYTFEYDDDGNFIAKKGDNVLKDKLEKPLLVKDVLTDFAAKNNWYTADGRGGGNEGGKTGGFETLHDIYKHMEKNKIDPMGVDGQQLVETFKNKK